MSKAYLRNYFAPSRPFAAIPCPMGPTVSRDGNAIDDEQPAESPTAQVADAAQSSTEDLGSLLDAWSVLLHAKTNHGSKLAIVDCASSPAVCYT